MQVLQVGGRRLKAVFLLGIEFGEVCRVLGLAVEVAAVINGRERPLSLLGEPGALLVGKRPERLEGALDAPLDVLRLYDLRQAGFLECLHLSPLKFAVTRSRHRVSCIGIPFAEADKFLVGTRPHRVNVEPVLNGDVFNGRDHICEFIGQPVTQVCAVPMFGFTLRADDFPCDLHSLTAFLDQLAEAIPIVASDAVRFGFCAHVTLPLD